MQQEFKTKKAAREAGFQNTTDWRKLRRNAKLYTVPFALEPRRDAEPTMVKGEAFYTMEQCEQLISRTAGRRRGLRLKPGAEPVTERGCHFGTAVWFDLYRLSDFQPKNA